MRCERDRSRVSRPGSDDHLFLGLGCGLGSLSLDVLVVSRRSDVSTPPGAKPWSGRQPMDRTLGRAPRPSLPRVSPSNCSSFATRIASFNQLESTDPRNNQTQFHKS